MTPVVSLEAPPLVVVPIPPIALPRWLHLPPQQYLAGYAMRARLTMTLTLLPAGTKRKLPPLTPEEARAYDEEFLLIEELLSSRRRQVIVEIDGKQIYPPPKPKRH
jgi:hypothetical protein